MITFRLDVIDYFDNLHLDLKLVGSVDVAFVLEFLFISKFGSSFLEFSINFGDLGWVVSVVVIAKDEHFDVLWDFIEDELLLSFYAVEDVIKALIQIHYQQDHICLGEVDLREW